MDAWLRNHRRALAHALRRLWSAPVNTLFGALVVGVTLALPAGGEAMLSSLLAFGRHVSGPPQLSIFLNVDADTAEAGEIERRLREQPGIAEFRFVARTETLKRFRETAGMQEVIDALPRNPFPDAFVVTPGGEDPPALEALRAAMAGWPKVEHVQLDTDWAKRLDAMLRLGRLAVLVLAGLLGVAIVAVSFNTIRLQILTQRAEIEVSRLLGATDAFIRRPFYYFGSLQGLLGGGVAWLIVLAGTRLLRQPVADLAILYGVELGLEPLGAATSVLLLGFAALLGWIGAWLSVSRHLREWT
jgi:cell division transport system permease protein